MIEKLPGLSAALHAVLFGGVVTIAACAYTGSSDDPVTRKFTWFSYMNADDIRANCVAGQPPRYRFIYNGVYIQQVRTYDIGADAGGGPYTLKVRVIGPTALNEVDFNAPFSEPAEDARDLIPGRGDIAYVSLTDSDPARLDQALTESGFFGPPDEGTRLTSESFFWIGAVCKNGVFSYNAIKWPSEDFTSATYPDVLLGWDPTGIPVNPPRTLSNFDIYQDEQADQAPRFGLSLGENGLTGVRPLF